MSVGRRPSGIGTAARVSSSSASSNSLNHFNRACADGMSYPHRYFVVVPASGYDISLGTLWCVRAPADGHAAIRLICVGALVDAHATDEYVVPTQNVSRGRRCSLGGMDRSQCRLLSASDPFCRSNVKREPTAGFTPTERGWNTTLKSCIDAVELQPHALPAIAFFFVRDMDLAPASYDGLSHLTSHLCPSVLFLRAGTWQIVGGKAKHRIGPNISIGKHLMLMRSMV